MIDFEAPGHLVPNTALLSNLSGPLGVADLREQFLQRILARPQLFRQAGEGEEEVFTFVAEAGEAAFGEFALDRERGLQLLRDERERLVWSVPRGRRGR
jgi:hypothetical protein